MVIDLESIWENFITTEAWSLEPWESLVFIEKSSPFMALIHVSEII